MILAAPLVIPFAEAVGISIATLGMAKAADMVNDYIQENPEQSIKILSTIVPGVGIGEIFMKKGKDEEVEEEVEVEDVDARDLTRAEKAKEMKRRFKEGTGDKREIGKKGYEEIILPGKEDEMLDEAEDRYDGGVEEVSKPKFDYKKFFKKRYADGGAIGIEVLFGPKVPAAPSQLVEESEIVLGYRGPGGYQGGSSSKSSSSSTNQGPAGGASAGGNYGGNKNPSQTYGGSIFTGGGGGPKPGTGSTGPAGGATKKITPTVSQTPNFGIKALEFAKKYNPLNFLFGTPVAAAEMTQKELIEMGAIEPGMVYGYNLTDKGEALEDFREVATKFKNAPQNTANTPQAALDFITDTARTGVYGKSDMVKNKEFIQSAIDKGFLADEKDYGLQKPLDEYLADGGRVGLFMGGSPLDGQALSIYNSMNAYGFSDQEIANALQEQGLYTPGSTPDPTPDTGQTIGYQGGDDGSIGGAPPSSLVSGFKTQTQERQNRLTNPNKVTEFFNKFTGGGQPDIGEMIRTGQIDTRKTSGIPLGIGAAFAKMMPDKYYDMSLGDQVFTQSQMGYTGPTVFGENTSGLNKDPFGLNTRSAFGNYAEAVGENFNSLRESLTGRLAEKYGVEFDEETGMFTGKNAELANKMTNMMRTKFNFRKDQLGAKNRLDAQIRQAQIDRERAEQVAKQKQEAAFQAQLNETQRQQRMQDLQRIERAYREDTGPGPGSYGPGGGSGVQSDGSYNDPFDPGGGEKDGGFIDGYNRRKYSDGGLATMFKEKR